jgi:hypothetical protein
MVSHFILLALVASATALSTVAFQMPPMRAPLSLTTSMPPTSASVHSMHRTPCTTPAQRGASTWRMQPMQSTSTWQEELNELLDIDTPLRSRRTLTRRFIGRLGEVASDTMGAARERNFSKLAPRDLSYGRALHGVHAFRKQLASDLLPDLLRKGVPRLVDGTPRVVGKIVKAPMEGPKSVVSGTRRAVASARVMVTDRYFAHPYVFASVCASACYVSASASASASTSTSNTLTHTHG